MKLDHTEKQILSTIHQYQMIESGDIIIIAVSGGPDSVCLLNVLVQLCERLNFSIVVAHLDHGFRPREDEKETRFVTGLAKRFDLPLACSKAHFETEELKSSIEEKAREIRYQFLEKVLADYHAQKIALGHNLNDQAETVLMHFLRGTGPTGLAGMPSVRGNRFIRPLIALKRNEIQAYLTQKGLPYMVDSSNLEKKYLRNKIRLELMPLLLDYQPRLIEHLGELAYLCRQENQFMVEESREQIHAMILNSSENLLDLSLTGLKSLSVPLQLRVIRQAIEKIKGNLRKIDSIHIKAILELGGSAKPQAKINLPDNITVKKIYEKLRFFSGSEILQGDFLYYMRSPGRLTIKEINRTLLCEEIPKKDCRLPLHSPLEALLDLEEIRWPLAVRNIRTGDRFIPLGLTGFKKLKDVFIDNKIPSEQRKRIPILTSDDTIVWVGGIRIDNRYRVKEKTGKILRCKLE